MQVFTGKEKDAETGLDYFGARYMAAAHGRFTGPDEPLADQHEGDPQSWNLFAYVRNNPLRYADPTGRTCQTSGQLTYDDLDGKGCSAVDKANREKLPDITVNERRAGGGEAYDYSGAYIPGSYRPPSPQQTAIHDPVPGAITAISSFAGDAQAAAMVGKLGGLGLRAGLSAGASRLQPVNLPAWRTITIDMAHVISGHVAHGARAGRNKTLCPPGMSELQIEKAVREAYRFGEKLRSQGDRVLIQGQSGRLTIEVWVNKSTGAIETADPKF